MYSHCNLIVIYNLESLEITNNESKGLEISDSFEGMLENNAY